MSRRSAVGVGQCAVFAVAAFFGAACHARDDAYWIGAVGEYEGNEAAQENLRGVLLAVKQVNAKGGIHGHPVRVIAKNDGGEGDIAATAARSFVADPRVSVVVGHTTSAAMLAAAPVYDGHLAAIATTASAPALSGISPWLFRVIASDSVSGAQLARFCATRAWRRASILYENDAYGRGLADAFAGSFSGTVMSTDPIPPDATDLSAFVRYYEHFHPDVVFVVTRPSHVAVELRRALSARHLPIAILASEGSTDLERDGPLAEDVYVGVSFSSKSGESGRDKFTRDYQAEFGHAPLQEAALAYDAATAAFAALSHAGADRSGIQRYLRGLDSTSGIMGATGRIYFDSLGDRGAPRRVLLQVKHGQVVALTDAVR